MKNTRFMVLQFLWLTSANIKTCFLIYNMFPRHGGAGSMGTILGAFIERTGEHIQALHRRRYFITNRWGVGHLGYTQCIDS